MAMGTRTIALYGMLCVLCRNYRRCTYRAPTVSRRVWVAAGSTCGMVWLLQVLTPVVGVRQSWAWQCPGSGLAPDALWF